MAAFEPAPDGWVPDPAAIEAATSDATGTNGADPFGNRRGADGVGEGEGAPSA